MRCPDCQKFVGLEFQEPEVQSLEVSDTSVTANIRIVRNCADCGNELKEATLEMEQDLEQEALDHLATPGEHELSVDEDSTEGLEEGGGRYKKSYFGATVQFTVRCSCGEFEFSGELSDKVPASGMDELT